MRLAALRPMLTHSPQAVGYTHQLEFDCPKCGPPYRILVNCDLGAFSGKPGTWGLTLPDVPRGDGWGGVTLTPSISNATHGRKKACGCHCAITDGDVLP